MVTKTVARSGFTLVEVMVAVAILGILSAVAIPSYRSYLRKGDRSAARAMLLENAQFMERFFTENNSYVKTVGTTVTPPTLPQKVSPRDAKDGHKKYEIAIRAVPAITGTTYAIEAVPVNNMVGDDCATLTFNHLGQRGTSGTLLNDMTTEKCWTQ